MRIQLADGRSFLLHISPDSCSVTIDGLYYVAADFATLLRGIESHFHIAPERPPLIEKSHIQLCRDALTSAFSPLTARQAARSALFQLSSRGDEEASQLLARLHDKPEPSKAALAVTRRIGKAHFNDVTHEELVEHVSNLVVRAKLLHELSDRLRF